MLRVASGEPLQLTQDAIRYAGHSIECRVNAEDPARDFLPHPGQVSQLRVPGGPGVRFDTMLYSGCTVAPFYDSLLGKLIVWAEDRTAALRRLTRALGEVVIEGVSTTVPLHRALVTHPDLAAHAVHTRWLEAWLEQHPFGNPATQAGGA
jgi:acetyl-CoA carboxylase, biotin carboxylase subunit